MTTHEIPSEIFNLEKRFSQMIRGILLLSKGKVAWFRYSLLFVIYRVREEPWRFGVREERSP